MRRRTIDILGFSFLDCIFCGFGAVLLLFVIINSRTDQPPMSEPKQVSGLLTPPTMEPGLQEDRLRLRIAHRQREIGVLRRELADINSQLSEANNRRASIQTRLDVLQQRVTGQHENAEASKERSDRLMTDIAALDAEIESLKTLVGETAEKQQHGRQRSHVGDGFRHYITGMQLSGARTLILLDCSSSMLSDHIVDIIRRRNMTQSVRRQAPKWRQAVAGVEWILTQLPVDGQFQIYGFSETSFPILESSAGNWLQVSDTEIMDVISSRLKDIVPDKGTSLYRAFNQLAQFSPPPDNIVLITDGLPTIGSLPAILGTVSGRRRLRLFEKAVTLIPHKLPVNVILYPMEGDPEAMSAYWSLAQNSGGSIFCPARDWP